ncbi:MAG: GNAT family N-acetyltransferase [Ruminococcus sp.]|nr:GNAT family N-acetyltransferase [Ruminococcus sp.]
MIREADRERLNRLRTTDPFYTRILSLYESYGGGYDFVGFWVQEADGKPVSAISRFEDKFSLYLTEDSDLEEVSAFLRFQGAGAVMTACGFLLDIEGKRMIEGQVLRYTGEIYNSDLELYTPEIKPLYALLQSCESEIFRVPEYMSFLSDVTHRRSLGKCTILGTNVDETLASAVMTVSETEDAVILGAVATHPDFRRRGLSRELVRTLSSKISEQGRAVCVFSASEANTRFYRNSGFEIVAGFREYIGSLW